MLYYANKKEIVNNNNNNNNNSNTIFNPFKTCAVVNHIFCIEFGQEV